MKGNQVITKEQAMELQVGDELYSFIMKKPVKARVNGKCVTWMLRPNEWRLPMKWGLRKCFDITHENCDRWFINYGQLKDKSWKC